MSDELPHDMMEIIIGNDIKDLRDDISDKAALLCATTARHRCFDNDKSVDSNSKNYKDNHQDKCLLIIHSTLIITKNHS